MELRAAHDEAWREAGISQCSRARYLDVGESEVLRMLYPDYSTKAAIADRARCRLGKRVTDTPGEAGLRAH